MPNLRVLSVTFVAAALSLEAADTHAGQVFKTGSVSLYYETIVAPVVACKIEKAISGSEFVVLDRSRHTPFYEEPEKFVQTADTFLSNRQ